MADYALSFVMLKMLDKTILKLSFTLYKKHKVIEPVLSDLNEVIQLCSGR